MTRLFSLTLLLLPAIVATAQAQAPRYKAEYFTAAEGVARGDTRSFLQDRYGFLWIGKRFGLQRYDGYSFTTFLPDPSTESEPATHRVTSLLEDRRGRLWVGTEGGLFRHELSPAEPGSQSGAVAGTFIHYRHDPDDPESLSGNNVGLRSLFEDEEGQIWVFTTTGLNRLDPETGRVQQYGPDPDLPGGLNAVPSRGPYGNTTFVMGRVMIQDRSGTVWVGTMGGGLNRFDREAESFHALRHDPGVPESLASDTLTFVYEAPSEPGVLWLGTLASGLDRFDPSASSGEARATGRFRHYRHDPADPASLSTNAVVYAYEDRRGRLWFATSDLVLHHFDRASGTFTRYRLPRPENAAPFGFVSRLIEDSDGYFWLIIWTEDPEVYWFDPESGSSIRMPADLKPFEGLADATGNLWFNNAVSGADGVQKLSIPSGAFRSYRYDPEDPTTGPLSDGVQDFWEDPDGTLWIVGQDGIARLDPGAENLHVLPLGDVAGYSMVRAPDGTLWTADLEHINRFDPVTGAFRRYRHDPDDPNSLTPGWVVEVYLDAAGTLWVGTMSGLNRYVPETDAFIRYEASPGRLPPSEGASFELPGREVWSVLEGGDGTLWVRSVEPSSEDTPRITYLSRLDRRDGRFFNSPPLPSIRVPEPTVSRDGAFWLPSEEGLYRYDPATEAVEAVFTQADGLPNNGVQGVLEDDQGRLWITTRGGLSRYDPKTGAHRTFDVADGLPSTRFFGSALRLRNGNMAFGTSNGFILFDPDTFHDNAVPPSVVLTGLRLHNEPDGGNYLRSNPAEATGELRLRHDQNDLTITFVGLHFREPEKNRYRYRLEGYDTAWSDPSALRQATYTNLSPGAYTFQVTASNADGVWSEEGARLVLTILPPWWGTTWAYALYGLLFAAGVFAVDRFQRRRLTAREREKARERELEQAREIEKAYTQLKVTQAQLVQQEKMASLGQMTAGIAHEIKNPLNFINNFAEVNEELAQELREALAHGEPVEDLLDDLKQNASLIKQHGQRADSIVHAMMQHASGGTGRREPTNINQLVSEHIELAYHGKRAQVPDLNVEIKRDLEDNAGTVEIVPQEIGRVLLNLLGNAFDAVHEHAVTVNGTYQPTVTVATRQVDSQVEICVKDNGPGIPAEIKDKIFEPFFTTKPTGSGTGLGLSLSYDIVTQGHGGALTVESTVGEGATFVITLPNSLS